MTWFESPGPTKNPGTVPFICNTSMGTGGTETGKLIGLANAARHLVSKLKQRVWGDGSVVRELTALAEDLGLVPSIHMVTPVPVD